jgi:organic hydroperoxide reductase OsmC/OhrA
MTNFPLHFTTKAHSTCDVSDTWTITENGTPTPIHCGLPLEFKGPGKVYTPEGLLGASFLSCIIGAFKLACEKSHITFTHLTGDAHLTMEKDASNGLCITAIDLHFHILKASNIEKAHKILEATIEACPIGKCLKAGKTYHIQIS